MCLYLVSFDCLKLNNFCMHHRMFNRIYIDNVCEHKMVIIKNKYFYNNGSMFTNIVNM